MSIYEKPGWQLNWPFKKNCLTERCFYKKVLLPHCFLLLNACLLRIQLNAQFFIYNNGWVHFNNDIQALNDTWATLLHAPAIINSTWSKNWFCRQVKLSVGSQSTEVHEFLCTHFRYGLQPRQVRVFAFITKDPYLIAALGIHWLTGSRGKTSGLKRISS